MMVEKDDEVRIRLMNDWLV